MLNSFFYSAMIDYVEVVNKKHRSFQVLRFPYVLKKRKVYIDKLFLVCSS